MDWSIQQVARLSGTTSRALRHYDALGLVPPSRVGDNGYRYYDAAALTRLQRVLLLRELGLGLERIAEVLDGRRDDLAALEEQLDHLRTERARLDRRIRSVTTTIEKRRGGEDLMAEEMFDGFDHSAHREEVEERWGREAYARSDAWWRGMADDEREAWKAAQQQLSRDWTDAAARGLDPAGAEAQQLAARHAAWLRGVPGTPAADDPSRMGEYLLGLGDMYVADPRFAANYGGEGGARFVRDALRAYVAAD